MNKRLVLAAAAALTTAAPAWSMVSVDEFSDTSSFSSCNFPGFAIQPGDMLFGNRLLGGGCQRIGKAAASTVADGTMAFGFTDLFSADGAFGATHAADLRPLAPDVRAPVDLTEGGLNTGLLMRWRASSDLRLTLSLANGTSSAQAVFDLAPSPDFQLLFVPFASLGGDAVAQSVVRFGYSFTDPTPQAGGLGGAAFSSSGAGDLDYIRAVAAVPEPGTWALMLAGVAGLGCARRLSAAPRARA